MSELPYREKLRADVFAIATRIVATEGLGALQARRIAAEAQCSVGSIYNVFGDLDGLIIAINVDTIGELGKALAASFENGKDQDTETRLADLALTYMHFALQNLNRWRAIFEHRLPAHREVPDHYRADQARLLALIEKIIAADIAAPPARIQAARALFAAVHGIIVLAIDNKLSDFDPSATEAEIRFIVKAAAKGLNAAA